MNYDPIPATGLDAGLGLVLTIAIAMLVAGAVFIGLSRSHKAGGGTALLLLLIVGTGIAIPGTPAQAATSDSVTASNSLTVIQTSTMEDLAPGVAPVPITGLITNNGPDSTFITAIDVEITSVTRALGSAAGTCEPSDYILFNTRMPVGRTLAAEGGSTAFTGASIGFNNTTTNQDACQHATVHLLYTTVAPPASIPATGLDAGLGLVFTIAIAMLVAGAVIIGLSRSHKAGGGTTLRLRLASNRL